MTYSASYMTFCKLYNYTDDNTLSASNKDLTVAKQQLTTNSETAVEWFINCCMQANTAKFQLALFSRNPNMSELRLAVQGVTLQNQELAKLLG